MTFLIESKGNSLNITVKNLFHKSSGKEPEKLQIKNKKNLIKFW